MSNNNKSKKYNSINYNNKCNKNKNKLYNKKIK